jgi:hypothetical protein
MTSATITLPPVTPAFQQAVRELAITRRLQRPERTSRRWYSAECNCSGCREAGWRVSTLAASIQTKRGMVEVVIGEPGGLRLALGTKRADKQPGRVA